MTTGFALLMSLGLWIVGLRCSAFFSGSETGFYRMSIPRLTIQAQANDPPATRLLWFARHPSYFVATTLIGNNVSNYITTLALGIAASIFDPNSSGVAEIGLTLLTAPVIFVLGELLPKHLYYRSPGWLMRRDSLFHVIAYWLFLPISFPLILITRFVERFGSDSEQRLDLLLGRNRLVRLLSQGHHEGLLTRTQIRLVEGTLAAAQRTVNSFATPIGGVLALPDTSTDDEVLAFAKRYGLTAVPLYRQSKREGWIGSVAVAELLILSRSVTELTAPMPEFRPETPALTALMRISKAGGEYGVIRIPGQKVTAIISRDVLLKTLFTPAQLPHRSP